MIPMGFEKLKMWMSAIVLFLVIKYVGNDIVDLKLVIQLFSPGQNVQ